MFEYGSFSKFSTSAEPKLNEIMVKEDKAVSEVTLKSKSDLKREACIILEKEETFSCVFDKIYKFLYITKKISN